MIKGFSSSFDSSGTGEEFTLYNETELKDKAAKMGEGVKYISGNKIIEKNKEGFWVPEFIFGKMFTSSNYDKNKVRTECGRNGFGAKPKSRSTT